MVKKQSPLMDAKIAKVTDAFAKLGGIGHTSDARRALEANYSDYVLKAMVRRGLLFKVAYDTYQLAALGR